MTTPLWFWVGFNLFVFVLLAIDLGVFHRRPHRIEVGEALLTSLGFVLLAALFGAGVWKVAGYQKGLEFATGYLIEWGLSLDNIFIIALIFRHFEVPASSQHRVLFWGIMGALVMRGVLILLGTTLIHEFYWAIYLFGAFLVVTGGKLLLVSSAEPDLASNVVLRLARTHIRITNGYHGAAFFVLEGGVRQATPLLLVLLVIETSDLMFALDSVPAIFAITDDSFIVYTSNVFAILGLRSLYFALSAFVERMVYLKYGLSLVLVFVGIKMLLADLWPVPTVLALGVTAMLIGGSIVISILANWRNVPLGQEPNNPE
ncbi:MAG: TerC family protein [Rhodospirillaceae bacterium]